ncbi:hypothetical protein DFH06DRAFT_1318871 [Mycena polygramma]|nr:hypothetical protein DFH06DRAFT_1318871 [Mycena polygramma]
MSSNIFTSLLGVTCFLALAGSAVATVGQASLFVNNGAVQQCGEVIQDSDLSMTIATVWDGGAHCGKKATVTFEGRSTVLMIEGECATCIASGIEITEAGYWGRRRSEGRRRSIGSLIEGMLAVESDIRI